MSSTLRRNKLQLKPLYRITADLKQGILTIQVYDAATKRRWRSEFNQKNFPKQPIFDIASQLIDAINSMNNINTQKIENFIPISISEYYKWCYVTVNGTSLPVFALRPVIINKLNSKSKSTSTSIAKMKDNKSHNDISIINDDDDDDDNNVVPSTQTRIYRQMTF